MLIPFKDFKRILISDLNLAEEFGKTTKIFNFNFASGCEALYSQDLLPAMEPHMAKISPRL
jgi:hypothetical protein